MAISLSGHEMNLIRHAAQPLDPGRRDAFVQAVLAVLESVPEIGEGGGTSGNPRDTAAVLGPSTER